jgi:predicted metal-binding membrane protein
MHHAGLMPLFLMWAAMMVGMMVPAEAPSLWKLARGRGAAAFLAGFLLPWIAFSFAAALLQERLHSWELLDHQSGTLASPALGAALFVAAGALQLTPWKRACLELCRETPARGSLSCGLRAGALSVVSCGVLMLVPLAAGGMSLLPMALLTALLLLERLAPLRWPVSSVSGVLFAASGIWTLCS